jgi:hypothetical protein
LLTPLFQRALDFNATTVQGQMAPPRWAMAENGAGFQGFRRRPVLLFYVR